MDLFNIIYLFCHIFEKISLKISLAYDSKKMSRPFSLKNSNKKLDMCPKYTDAPARCS